MDPAPVSDPSLLPEPGGVVTDGRPTGARLRCRKDPATDMSNSQHEVGSRGRSGRSETILVLFVLEETERGGMSDRCVTLFTGSYALTVSSLGVGVRPCGRRRDLAPSSCYGSQEGRFLKRSVGQKLPPHQFLWGASRGDLVFGRPQTRPPDWIKGSVSNPTHPDTPVHTSPEGFPSPVSLPLGRREPRRETVTPGGTWNSGV